MAPRSAIRAGGRSVLGGALLVVTVVASGGCLTLKADHDELAAEVAKLRVQVADQEQKSKETLDKADKLTKEVEDILRGNQADLGNKVANMELEIQDLRGAVENADYMASAASQELSELRGDVDSRLKALEEKLNEATSIPEGKEDLWNEAERQTKKKNEKAARRLWRTFVSRYPDDSRVPEAKFNVGLTYFTERDYKSALGEFYHVIQDSPTAQVIPDALYYSGLAFAKLGQCENAIAYFQALREKKTKAPTQYKQKATEQIAILKKDKGDICLDGKKAAKPE